MDLNVFLAALRRRWYLTLLGGVIAVAITALAVIRIGPTYEAEGSVLLFPPTTTIKNGTTLETQGNPYLMLGSLSQARDIVIRALESRTATAEFAEHEPLATYEVTPDFATSGPIIVLIVSAQSPDAAVGGLAKLLSDVPRTLEQLQSGLGLPQAAYITSRPLTADVKPAVVRSGQIRSGIVAGAIVMGGVLLLLGLVDSLLKTRAATTLLGRRSVRQPRHLAPKQVDTEQLTTVSK